MVVKKTLLSTIAGLTLYAGSIMPANNSSTFSSAKSIDEIVATIKVSKDVVPGTKIFAFVTGKATAGVRYLHLYSTKTGEKIATYECDQNRQREYCEGIFLGDAPSEEQKLFSYAARAEDNKGNLSAITYDVGQSASWQHILLTAMSSTITGKTGGDVRIYVLGIAGNHTKKLELYVDRKLIGEQDCDTTQRMCEVNFIRKAPDKPGTYTYSARTLDGKGNYSNFAEMKITFTKGNEKYQPPIVND